MIFQLDFPSITYLDSLHDGDYLAPIINHIHLGGYWTSSFTVHGGENIFQPLLALKIFNVISVASVKFIPYLITFFIKFLSLILSFQISQISKLEKNYKLIMASLSKIETNFEQMSQNNNCCLYKIESELKINCQKNEEVTLANTLIKQ